MKEELEKQLVENYPRLFRGKDAPVTENLMAFGCECGDGWFNIIKTACDLISSRTNADTADFLLTQIKEKYGTLRIYYAGGDEYIAGIVDMAEAISAHTCEICGAPGKSNGGGWLTTRCETHNV